GPASLAEREMRLRRLLLSLLAGIEDIEIRSPRGADGVGIVTFTSRTLPADVVARRLAVQHGALCRAGLHCAPGSHAAMGTLRTGAVRFSLGWASTEEEVRRAAAAVAALHAHPG